MKVQASTAGKEGARKLKYRGFMYIKCCKCGKEEGFMPRQGREYYRCDSCGSNTEFKKPLVPMYVNCECGSRFKYMTNMEGKRFDINCFDCGAPVAVEWNEKRKQYETIR